ncbi:MAG TPA: tRNA epoxyqueuosine(34) reductase QueG [Vicinamibacterales bacterium]|nr:tRNA epoxyqueuosine(34) reductase QueG [Vicinamibacterales bacterium]
MITAEQIKARAIELGFDLCGIAPADSFPELRSLDEWLARGYAGEMAWMSRSAERRADVRNVVPGARSVVVTGTIYATASPSAADAARAVISRYARGDDYHDVLESRLDALLEWMRAESPEPFDARAYVDTGPVQERVYAQYAGLGWIGKNTCLINAEHGSWLFLAEIITTLALEPDVQALEQCGSCRRCLDACPTGALVDAGVLDSTRCISYLTIELRSSIPEEYRAALGNHVYGCDICQDVCPHNQPSSVSSDAPWQARAGLDAPRLVELWRRPDSELRALIKGSAMTRAKLTGLRRNLAVAIGNSGDADALAALDARREDQPSTADPMVREHIEWARLRPDGLRSSHDRRRSNPAPVDAADGGPELREDGGPAL